MHTKTKTDTTHRAMSDRAAWDAEAQQEEAGVSEQAPVDDVRVIA